MAETKEGFDKVFEFVGSCGKFQIGLLLIVSIQCVIFSWHHLSYIFFGAVPEHWCRVPELEDIGWSEQQIKEFAIPSVKKGTWESCFYYDLDYEHFSTLSFDEALRERNTLLSFGQKYCSNGWNFDKSTYESTLVTEFQTVCNDRYLVATIQATYMCGVFIGSLILGSLSDRFIGRKKSVLVGIVLVQVGALLAAYAGSYWTLIVCRFFVAFGVAGAYQNCYVLLMEYTGTKSRSAMGILQQLPFAFGYMLMALYAYYFRDWQSLQLAFTATGIVLFSYFLILPESARWLAVTGQSEKSLEQLVKVAAWNKKDVNPEELMQIVRSCCEQRFATFTIASEGSERKKSWITSSLGKLCRTIRKTVSLYLSLVATPEIRKRTILIWSLFICVDLVYYGVVFDSATLTEDPYLMVFLGGISEIPAYTVVVPFLANWGRRPTIVTTFFAAAASTLAVTFISPEFEIARMIFTMTGKLFITTCFAVIYLLGTELYPTATRTTGLAAAVFMGRVGSILAPFIVDGTKSVSNDMPNIIFGVVCIVSGFISLLIPEMRDARMADTLSDLEEISSESGRKSSHQRCSSEQNTNTS